jgi:hypothetical protein
MGRRGQLGVSAFVRFPLTLPSVLIQMRLESGLGLNGC